MLLHLHRPGPPLDRFVELVTFYADYQPKHTREIILPDGAVEIIVDLTDTPKKLYDRRDHGRFTDFRGAWISGMRRGWIVVEAGTDASMVVIRFRPGGAYPFLGFALEGVTDTVHHLGDVMGAASSSLRDRILEAPDIGAKMAAVETWLRDRAAGRLDLHPVVEYLSGRLFAPAGIRIGDVVAEIGYSQRHVLGIFRRWVGLSPKQYGRIRRFQGMIGALARTAPCDPITGASLQASPLPEPDWAEVAADHGYYDQSHLIRDFREYAGMTPGQYAASYRGLENYLPID